MENDTLTGKIIGISFEVHDELGIGFVEKVYENSLKVALEQAGFKMKQQVPIEVVFRGEIVGDYLADLIVNDEVIIELKAVKRLLPEHQAQLINYLKASRLNRGLLINFGPARLEVKRGDLSIG